jgi:O-antigen/teichoic acid export membrane protein
MFLVTTVFVTFLILALPSALVKYVSEFVGGGKIDLARGVIKKGVVSGFVLSAVFSSVCFLASPLISSLLFGSQIYRHLLELLAFDIFILMFLPFIGNSLIGLQRFSSVAVANSLGAGIKYATAIVLLNLHFGVSGVISGWIAGDLSILIIEVFFLLKFRGETAPVPFSLLAKYSLPIYLAGFSGYFSARVDQFLIIFYLGLEKLGLYNVAITASWIVSSISDSISSALFPQFAERFGRKDINAMSTASLEASRYVSIIYIPLAVGLATVALPAITLFAGTRYSEGAIPLAFLSLTSAISCFGVIANSVVSSLGETRIFLWASLLSFFIDAIACMTLIPILGIVGASFGKALSIIVGFGFVMYNLMRIFGWHFDVEALKKSWISAVIMGSIVLIVQQYLVGLFYLPLYILIGGASYFVLLRLLHVVNTSDIALARRFLPKRLEFVADILALLLIV